MVCIKKRKGTKKNKSRTQRDACNDFHMNMCSQFELQIKTLIWKKDQIRKSIEQSFEAAQFVVHRSVLHKKLKDLTEASEYDANGKIQEICDESAPISFHFRKTTASGDVLFHERQKFIAAETEDVMKTQRNMFSTKKCVITPKINPASPVGMLRVPQQGEFAVSATGSPLLVSTSSRDDTANINIPLKNGRKMLILPMPHVNTESISDNLAPDVRKQLETLSNTLNEILNKL